jgi:hypothetical protein
MTDQKRAARDEEEQAHEQRVRNRAYRLWLEEGQPEGRADTHWYKACELVAIEENYKDTLKPNPTEEFERSPSGEPIEPIAAVRNLGEFPTLTDQGEEAVFPERALAVDASKPASAGARKSAPRTVRKKTK